MRLSFLSFPALIFILIAGPAGWAMAQVPDAYQALLAEADRRQEDDARFAETADMVAALVEGGRAAVHAEILANMPGRASAVADWPLPDATPATASGAEPEPVVNEAGRADADPSAESGEQGRGRVFYSPLSLLQDDGWSGAVRAGVQVDRGNSDLTDFSFALELDREFGQGWRLDSQFEYYLSESANVTTRDNWLAELRGTREFDNGFGYYAGGSYERDLVGLYYNSAFLTGGAIWHVLDNERTSWGLRAGAGQRYREETTSGATLTDAVGELGSSFSYQVSETAAFSSETTAFLGGGSRIDQRFTLTNQLFGDWAVQTGLRIEHEFEERPGFEPTDIHVEFSLLYAFD